MAESMVDEFGIKKIYPTNPHPNRAKPWLWGKGDWHDRRYDGWFDGNWDDYDWENDDAIIKFDASDAKGRFPVLALPVNQYYDLEWNFILHNVRNQSILRKRGFMGTKNDWKNVEVTMYFKVVELTENNVKAMAFSVRGGPHHGNGDGAWWDPRLHRCYGTAYYVRLNVSGEGVLEKELAHDRYALPAIFSGNIDAGSEITGRWIGMKGVFYTKANGNPYIELWLDKDVENNFNNWERVLFPNDAGEDNGRWPRNEGGVCGGEQNERITWGGPGVIFKLDGLRKVDMKWVSVREIMPPEGWPLRYLLNAREFPFPFSMRALAQEHGLTPPISLRELTQREAELYPFP